MVNFPQGLWDLSFSDRSHEWFGSGPKKSYRGCRLNVARLGGTFDATLSPGLHEGIGGPNYLVLRDLARRAAIGLVLHKAYATLAYIYCSRRVGRAVARDITHILLLLLNCSRA